MSAEPLLVAEGLYRIHPAARGTGGLRRRGEVVALAGVDVAVHPGERLGVVGASGSGKTTLARLLLGLEAPDAGRVLFDGREVRYGTNLRWYRPLVQLVPQDPSSSLDPHQRVRDSIAEPLECLRLPGDHDARVRDCLDAVGLEHDLAGRFPAELSGGQRQRVAIARALAPAPRVIVADEAVSALDASIRHHVLDTLARMCDRDGIALVFVAHDLGAVARLCHRVIVMSHGKVVDSGPMPAAFITPRHEVTRALVEATLPAPAPALSA